MPLVLVLADRLKGNAVQIGNRPAAVSFAKELFTVVPLIFIKKTGRIKSRNKSEDLPKPRNMLIVSRGKRELIGFLIKKEGDVCLAAHSLYEC